MEYRSIYLGERLLFKEIEPNKLALLKALYL
jgi:hypothetical protein